MISILYYLMLQKQCHWTCVIRILELVIGVRSTHVICVSENDSNAGLQVRIHLGAKNITFQFWRGWCHCRHIVSNAGYKTRIPLLFIVMIESIY